MFISPIAAVLTTAVIAGCVFAFWKGSSAERSAAGVILANLLVLRIADSIHLDATTVASSGVYGLLIDGLTALVLLILVLRYASLWLGGIMLLYAVLFALHAFYFVTERPSDRLHAIVNNLDTITVTWCLVIGTAVAWRRRIRERAKAVEAPAP